MANGPEATRSNASIYHGRCSDHTESRLVVSQICRLLSDLADGRRGQAGLAAASAAPILGLYCTSGPPGPPCLSKTSHISDVRHRLAHWVGAFYDPFQSSDR